MYDKNKRVVKGNITVNELCNILSTLSARAKICICGDSNCYIHVEQDGSVINLDNEDLEECYINDMDKSFKYGGHNFIPLRQLNKSESENIKLVMSKLRSDIDLGFFADKSLSRKNQKFSYSYDAFYDAATNKDCDIFKCVENGKLYIPCENELFEYI